MHVLNSIYLSHVSNVTAKMNERKPSETSPLKSSYQQEGEYQYSSSDTWNVSGKAAQKRLVTVLASGHTSEGARIRKQFDKYSPLLQAVVSGRVGGSHESIFNN